jgi:hypothetical protein
MACMCGGCAGCLKAQGFGQVVVESSDESDARDELCRDARALVDFLDSSIGAQESYPWAAATPACMVDFEAQPTGRLLTLAFDVGQPAQTRIGAMDELQARYAAERADAVVEVALRIATENAGAALEGVEP